ncbi:MarR family transcriptional regulator [Burkholderia vietnamiensis]|uniref:MarR family transcriptional regulator n=1 Tax=Burkholderia vietnamiensis TaxID=60552 RepID=UPI001592E6B3|nr:helix-turn-helix domain-containing protein [Burkholderia vietnamiensis]
MTQIEKMLQLIVDRPGITSVEIADELEVTKDNVTTCLARFVQNEKVRLEKKPVEGTRPINAYFPGQSLVNEVDGVKQIVMPARRGRPARTAPPEGSDFRFGFFSNGALQISKNGKSVELLPGEASALIDFLDSINVDKIVTQPTLSIGHDA